MSGAAKVQGMVVCVTGASGFVASWLVKLLLQRGYMVHATVLDPNDPTETDHLVGLEGAKERLCLFKADLMEEGSFDSAVAGCEGVFHTACPVIFNAKDPEADVVRPAVKGTLNVLASCKKVPTVKRVIFTSSMAANIWDGRSLAPDVVVDESWYSDPELCKGSSVMWYVLSKTLAEDAAWKFVKENGMDMVTINPGLAIGPMLQPTLNESTATILYLINGAETYPDTASPMVHVKDVAEAHILAFEIPSADGRVCLAESVVHYADIVKMLHELYPSMQLPDKCENARSVTASRYQVSKTKSESLGIHYTPLKVSLKGTVDSLKEKKFI